MVTLSRHLAVLMFGLVALAIGGCERVDSSQPGSGSVTVRVAVASSARQAIAAIADEYVRQHPGVRIDVIGGATVALASQLRAGAPYDLFYAADLGTPTALERDGVLVRHSVATYAKGELVLWMRGRADGAVGVVGELTLSGESVRRLAIADERIAPYGRAARQVLLRAKPHHDAVIVTGDSVEQVAHFASTGAVDAALLPRSQAEAIPPTDGHVVAIDPGWYDPIVQAGGVATRSSGSAARSAQEFHAFTVSRQGQEIISRFGFVTTVNGGPR